MKGFGVADMATRTQATADSVYMWFSMTKIMTATAVMQLAEQGRLRLDDPVNYYIADFPGSESSTPATVRHLLNHSSGLSNPMPIRWIHPATEVGPELGAFLSHLLTSHGKLRSDPGQKASYSNIGYVALGVVVAVASGIPYERYVREKILKPLGMSLTDFTYTPDMIHTAAIGYQKRMSLMGLVLPWMGIPEGILAGKVDGFISFNRFYLDGSSYGGLIGPIRDAARFLQAHLNHGRVNGVQMLSPDSVSVMQQISARGDKLDFGLGWFREHTLGLPPDYLQQLGGGAGFSSIMRIYPKESLGIVIMGNSTSFDIKSMISALRCENW